MGFLYTLHFIFISETKTRAEDTTSRLFRRSFLRRLCTGGWLFAQYGPGYSSRARSSAKANSLAREFTLMHSDGLPQWEEFTLARSYGPTASRSRNWRERRDVGLTGRTAFPPRQMEKETRLTDGVGGEREVNGRHPSNR